MDYNEARDFHRGLAWAHRGGKLVSSGMQFPPRWQGGQWLLIDRRGAIVWRE
ncbi:MAG: hypothetical protein JXB62_02775 [Pirellulales bacterium]|nr:hypothetical protein [Pirellulales bacterium]